ncbi:hypothetical protein [Balneola vulgaris]|jgi:hypothetical protein|uniref:hypothetical protein n=1 Tax=Balneola vulgaris TaxID=287535 RepID=UPI000379FC07|nr:hypothetical protein [Balneola vulgaris]
MKKLVLSIFGFCVLALSAPVQAQSDNAHTLIKEHINEMVVTVEKKETTTEKRAALNESLDEMIAAIDKVSNMKAVPTADKEGLNAFKTTLEDRKNELNGAEGFEAVPANQLNDYANFIQQDLEQADRVVTLSLTTALLIVLILLLL